MAVQENAVKIARAATRRTAVVAFDDGFHVLRVLVPIVEEGLEILQEALAEAASAR